jgi:hypothetical protein
MKIRALVMSVTTLAVLLLGSGIAQAAIKLRPNW